MALHLLFVAPMVPRVHLNGTGRTGLIDPLIVVLERCSDLRTALSAAAPHGRDYYVIGDAAHAQAVLEHQARMQRVREIETEIEALAMAVHDQGSSRERAA